MIPDEDVARRLVNSQFRHWAELPLRAVHPGGWDNRTFRLGRELLVRLPSADGYAAAVAKEQRWLPVIAPLVPLRVPQPVAVGAPTAFFPRPWSVYRWIEGEVATDASIDDAHEFARTLADFLVALACVPTDGAPLAGDHSFWRGAHPIVYDDDVQRCLHRLNGVIDAPAARRVWETARNTAVVESAVWFHGDVSPGNMLLRSGRLSAMIDFGTSGVGDPACDLAIAWTMPDQTFGTVLRDALPWDDGVWARARAWALWKAMLLMEGTSGSHDSVLQAQLAKAVVDRVLADA